MTMIKKLTVKQLDIMIHTQTILREEIDVTPEIAAYWLEKYNDKNRPVAPDHVNTLARAMAERRFRTTHQGMAFDRRPAIIDGQHRLHAIVKSGVTARLLVTFGADYDDMAVLDIQNKRKPRDMMTIYHGTASNDMRASVVRMINVIEGGPAKLDSQEVMTRAAERRTSLDWLCENVGSPALRYAPFAAAVVYAYERMPEKTAEFVAMINSGANLPPDSGALVGFTLLNRNKEGGGGSMVRQVMFHKMLRAIGAHCSGERMSKSQAGKEGYRYFSKKPVVAR